MQYNRLNDLKNNYGKRGFDRSNPLLEWTLLLLDSLPNSSIMA